MPEPLHPPYNQVQPRTLNRWLDINSQNGPLGRAQGYIDIPVFSFNPDPRPYAYIAAVFHYVATNNFSICQPFPVFTNKGCILCISYRKNGNIVRYSLNEIPDGAFNMPVTQYKNQRIQSDFDIEVWCYREVGGQDAMNDSIIRLLTSVKLNVDTRFGDDKSITAEPEVRTNLFCDFDLPLPIITFDQPQQ